MAVEEPQNDPQNDPQDSPALAALAALGRDAPRPHTAAELEQGLGALRARIAAAQSSRARGRGRWPLAGATVACAVIAILLVVVSRRDRPDGVAVSRVEGGTILDGGYLSQSGPDGIKLYFQEGSTFQLAPQTRGRLRAVTRDGAHLALERGSATLRITRNPARRWLVEAGPFTVTVKGTRFTVSWDPSSERFELRLRDGWVVVSGPTVGEALALRAGQRLVVSLPRAESVITDEPAGRATEADDGPEAAGSAPAVERPRAPEAPPPAGGAQASRHAPAAADGTRGPSAGAAPAAPSPTRARGPSAPPRRWAAEVARGNWDGILADVDAAGVDATLEGASSEELFAVADAARYRRRPELARAALLAQRRRFPHAPRAVDVSFLLGRVEELRDGGGARALGWYDDYLAHAPTGTYAAEALGRKMTLTSEMRGAEAARPIADTYLHRFPRGSYAGAARALQRVP